MPLRCLDGQTSIHAFDLTPEAWKALADDNRRRRHLVMPCCAASVALRTSRQGTQHFAHKAIGACTTAPETEEHLRLKRIAVEVARDHGWAAETEVSHGVHWRADVMATKGEAKVAIEIQWSQQTDEETLRRQARYAAFGVRGIWLLRQRSFARDSALPAARVCLEDGAFQALVPAGFDDQRLDVQDFVGAALTGRLHYGLPLNFPARIALNAGALFCWKCGAETPILSSIAIAYGPHHHRFSVADFTELPELFAIVRGRLPEDAGLGIIKARFSRTQERAYLSNGCAHCDALIGEFHEHEAWDSERVIASFSIVVDEAWRGMLAARSSAGWGVYAEM